MTAIIKTFTFTGVKAVDIEVQVKISNGMSSFSIVGLPDKAVAESRERVRAAINSMGLSLPAKKITVNLAPADIEKVGSHFDLPIALGILVEMGILSQSDLDEYVVMGELSLNGEIAKITGTLSASMTASSKGLGVVCPESCGAEAICAGDHVDVLAPSNLLSIINHIKGTQILSRPEFQEDGDEFDGMNLRMPDLRDIKGQEKAKRALEIVAAGGHNMLMVGPPGTGKSMLASRLPGILPEPTTEELLEINMIASISGLINDNSLIKTRPYRDPHHSCSMPAMVGGGKKAKPGEVTLAHRGVLFLDELAEFPRQVLDSLRQPLESGKITVSRASNHVTYPARIQLIAAMNPCPCGYAMDESRRCSRAPLCAEKYQNKISGPLLDRIDVFVAVPQVNIFDLEDYNEPKEGSAEVKERVIYAREIQRERYRDYSKIDNTNASVPTEILSEYARICDDSKNMLKDAVNKLNLSMRGYNRILRVARSIADLNGMQDIHKSHIVEALSYRRDSVLKV